MRFSTQTLIALMASPLLALADGNTFTNSNYNGITAGKTFDLTWKPTTSGTVSIILRSGASNNLTPGVYVAQGLTNSGSYSWTVPSDITRGTDYALEIVDDSNPNDTSNTAYTPQFVIDSTNTVASSTSYISQASSAASSASSAASSGISSANSSASSASKSASSASSSASKSESSAASSASKSESSAASSASKSASSAASSASSRASSATSSAAATSTGGAVASAMPYGLLALVAAAAL
ncbi:hypothetical protein M436DRAFT_39998 [Aureobasidium namibiae CBS 147.97]|uniref:Yeast cell wall synthesis Kre9/Knh1-like N-terminal domain-containing protein n=1 Tax=Aureobasidium namibiae CBS 147.97 TaxID=1043004 RepID=A0A074WT53_9PEZI